MNPSDDGLTDRTVVLVGGGTSTGATPCCPARPRGRNRQTVLYLFGNRNTTGSTLYPGGGYSLR